MTGLSSDPAAFYGRPRQTWSMDETRRRQLQESHERLLRNPRITMLGSGPLDPSDISREFLDRLTELTPTQRRYALAKACTHPWRDRPEETPACYQRQLDHATFELEQERTFGATAALDLETLFSGVGVPISEVLLRQCAEMSAAERRSSLAFVIGNEWPGQPPDAWRTRIDAGELDWPDTAEPPEWAVQDFHLWGQEAAEEYRRRHGLPDPDRTPNESAREVEAALNWAGDEEGS